MKYEEIKIGIIVKHKLTGEKLIIIRYLNAEREPNILVRRKNLETFNAFIEELEILSGEEFNKH